MFELWERLIFCLFFDSGLINIVRWKMTSFSFSGLTFSSGDQRTAGQSITFMVGLVIMNTLENVDLNVPIFVRVNS